MPVAFACALLAGQASAGIDIPDEPLTAASRVAPNILFILDDSGSMTSIGMPEEIKSRQDTAGSSAQTGLDDNPLDRSALNNNIYYDTNVEYEPWLEADGTRRGGGEDVTRAFMHWNFASGVTRNLVNNSDSIFYVPKSGVTASTNPSDFDRYQIRISGGAPKVVRTTGAVSLGNATWNNQDINNNNWWQRTVIVLPGATQLKVIAQNGSGGNPRLYLRYGSDPSTTNYDHRAWNRQKQVITVTDPTPGVWHIGVLANGGRRNDRDISAQVLLHTYAEALPTTRTQEDELKNFATWYSYSRSRMKSAKAGAGDAFGRLDRTKRIGYRSLHNNGTFNIPVQDGNDGRFEGTSRATWYSRLYAAQGAGNTPLLTSLKSAGDYFSQSDSSGPYGPQVGSDQLSCRQNFTILTTDGFWNETYTGGGGNQDGTASPEITGPGGRSFTYTPAAPYTDGWSNTLADVAMRYWKTDLRTDLPNIVPSSDPNPAFWQHMVTFGISIGLSGTTGRESVAEVLANPPVWPDPTTPVGRLDADRIDDLLHAAVNGRGQFVSARNPSAFAAALESSLREIDTRVGSFSNVTSNSTSLDADTVSFAASYQAGTWLGELTATSVVGGALGPQLWTTSAPGKIPDFSVRRNHIFTSHLVGVNRVGTAFPSALQETELTRVGALNYPVTGAENAAYLMGDQSKEIARPGGTLRNRVDAFGNPRLLGDIVNSSPAYVKETDTIYVGANDGMLHAFDASNGVEQFAFIPAGISTANLSTLSRPDYSHRFFVDGPITVSSRNLTPSQSILVGALGRGGKGLYSLDVTDPANFDAGDFNWELTETPGGHMGLVLGKPLLAQASTGANVAIIGNGPNSASERAVLIVIDLDTGAVIRQIDTGAGDASEPNGLSAPTAVYAQDGKTLAYVYAGDLLGNVWKFDLTNPNPSLWTRTGIFQARNSSAEVQPITAGLTIGVHPVTFERWVFFGTGRYLTFEDATGSTTEVQSMYGFVDRGGSVLTRADLSERDIVLGGTVAGYPVRGFESNQPLDDGTKGWYIDLVEPGSGAEVGERIVQNTQLVATVLVSASVIPTTSDCDPGGRGYLNALDAFTGTSTSVSYFDLNGDRSTADELVGTGGDQVAVGSVNLGKGMPTLPNLLRGLIISGGSGTGGAGSTVGSVGSIRPTWGLVSWHELRRE